MPLKVFTGAALAAIGAVGAAWADRTADRFGPVACILHRSARGRRRDMGV